MLSASPVILSAAKDLTSHHAGEILRCAQDDNSESQSGGLGTQDDMTVCPNFVIGSRVASYREATHEEAR